MYRSVGFIGTGVMGSAMAKAVVKSGLAEEIILANKTAEKAEKVCAELEAMVTEAQGRTRLRVADNSTAASECDLIFLGVKPQMMAEMLSDIAPYLAERDDRFVLCTMAAGLTAEKISSLAGGDYPVIRIMPNTPAAIGCGVILYCGKETTESELKAFELLTAPAGRLSELPERLMDAASSVAGCGPAFVCMFVEALADGAVACGLPRKQALQYAAGMVEGTARLILASGEHPGALKDAVCSPGGTTIQGVRVLEEHGFRAAATDAVIAAYEKTLKLK